MNENRIKRIRLLIAAGRYPRRKKVEAALDRFCRSEVDRIRKAFEGRK